MNFVFAGKNKIRFLVFVAFVAQKIVLDLQSKPQLNLYLFYNIKRFK